MKKILVVVPVILILTGFISINKNIASLPEASSGATTVIQEQLLGIKSLYLSVYVDYRVIPDGLRLRDEIYSLAANILQEEGLELTKDDISVFLSIKVFSYPIEIENLENHLLLMVMTELLDDARLLREPSLDNPHGYVTWSQEWVFICSLDEFRDRIKKEVMDQVEDFCIDRNLAEEYKHFIKK